MALPASTTFEVRPTAGSDLNGGGFVPGSSGTDFSQQNAAQYSFTDLVITGTDTVSSVSHAFGATDVGNLMQIASGTGFTPGFYEIVSVAAGVATLDRSPGTNGSTGGAYAVGGALATFSPLIGQYTNGNLAWLRGSAGTLAITATIGNLNEGISIIGYGTTRGDDVQAEISTATNAVSCFTLSNQVTYFFSNLKCLSTAGSPGVVFATANASYNIQLSCENMLCQGWLTFTNAGNSNISLYPLLMDSIECKNMTGAGFDWSFNAQLIMFCTACSFHNNALDGMTLRSQQGSYSFNRTVWWSNGGNGLTANNSTLSSVSLINCSGYANTGDGYNLGVLGLVLGQNNILALNGGWGLNAPAALQIEDLSNNFFFGNTSGAHTGVTTENDVIGTGDPYISGGTGNFNLNNTAGAGALCRGAGIPSTIPG